MSNNNNNSDSGITFNLDMTKNSKEKENRDIQNIINGGAGA